MDFNNISTTDITAARNRNRLQVTELKEAQARGDQKRVDEIRALLALDKPLFKYLRDLNR